MKLYLEEMEKMLPSVLVRNRRLDELSDELPSILVRNSDELHTGVKLIWFVRFGVRMNYVQGWDKMVCLLWCSAVIADGG
jgi:hypothetical protein